jgi:glycosyltransferase involved in cell wall biosynthesis
MQTAKVFVMPSKSEGGPRVALEAMGVGLPVIAAPVGVMPDAIENGRNGLLTDGTLKSLRAGIECLLGDADLREKLGGEARGVLSLYDGKKLLSDYASFLRKLAA